MPLYRLVYRSDIALTGTPAEIDTAIDALVDVSTRANKIHDLSGALFASSGIFIQALEGPLPALEATFEKICSDLRHRHVRLVEFAAAEERAFSEWSMVRVAQETELFDFCRSFGAESPGRIDTFSTGILISLMRVVLLTQEERAGGTKRLNTTAQA